MIGRWWAMQLKGLLVLSTLLVFSGNLSALASAPFWEGIHPYNAARNKIAQSAVAALTNLNLLDMTTENASNLDSLKAQELEWQANKNAVTRNLVVFAICTDSKSPAKSELFDNIITNRLVPIFGGSAQDASSLAATNAADASIADDVLSLLPLKALMFKHNYGATPPAFNGQPLSPDLPDDLKKFRNQTNQENFDNDWKDYKTTYNKAIPASLGNGILFHAFCDLNQAFIAISNLQAEADILSEQLKATNSIIDDAVKRGQTNTVSSVMDRATNALTKLNSLLADAERSSNPVVKKVSLEAHLSIIDEVIAAAVSGQPSTNLAKADPETRRAALIASQLPGLAQSAANLEKAYQMPKVSSLLIQRDMLSIQLDAENQEIQLMNQRVTAYQQKYNAVLLEVQMIQDLFQEETTLGQDATNTTILDPSSDWATHAAKGLPAGESLTNNLLAVPVTTLLSSDAPKEIRRATIAAVLKQAGAIRVAGLREDEADLQLINLDYLEANAANQEATRMWNALISTPVNEIASYYSAGFKPEVVADILVKGLGLGAIAWRVH